MNGIIHNCTHGDRMDPSTIFTYDQMMTKVFQYIEKLFDIIKPKRLLYMAIDGIRPSHVSIFVVFSCFRRRLCEDDIKSPHFL
jgi:hypothetical protein